ncbi:MAG: type II/IV secretion system ATPase subunit [Acidianus sp.]|jgi:flagellar protein FlaI|nr:type II/IV secretion system ATPase subunit [Acidianus sp.]
MLRLNLKLTRNGNDGKKKSDEVTLSKYFKKISKKSRRSIYDTEFQLFFLNSPLRVKLQEETGNTPDEPPVSWKLMRELLHEGNVEKIYSLSRIDEIFKYVKIYIYNYKGRKYYIIEEPLLTDTQVEIVKGILDNAYISLPILEMENKKKNLQELKDKIRKNIEDIVNNLEIESFSNDEINKILYYVIREMTYSVLTVPMYDPNIEEIECSGYDRPVTVVHKDYTEYFRIETNIYFEEEERLKRFVERISEMGGKGVSIANPIQDILLGEGHRVAVSYSNEVSLPGSTFDIRKHPEEPFTIVDLINNHMVTIPAVAYLWILAEAKKFILMVGPTGSGKTTFLNAFLTLLNPNAKFFTIEDTPEIKLPHKYWVRTMTRSTSFTGAKEIGLADLIKMSLRYRPDYIIVGEVRGSEMINLVQAVASGHGGLTTFHGGSPEDVKTRIIGLLPEAVAEEFNELLSTIVIIKRIVDYETRKQIRRITEIWENVAEENSKETKFLKIMERDPKRDTLIPEKYEEVLKTSIQLRDAGRLLGWDMETVEKEMVRRIKLLSYLANKNINRYEEIAYILNKYYINPTELMDQVDKELVGV